MNDNGFLVCFFCGFMWEFLNFMKGSAAICSQWSEIRCKYLYLVSIFFTEYLNGEGSSFYLITRALSRYFLTQKSTQEKVIYMEKCSSPTSAALLLQLQKNGLLLHNRLISLSNSGERLLFSNFDKPWFGFEFGLRFYDLLLERGFVPSGSRGWSGSRTSGGGGRDGGTVGEPWWMELVTQARKSSG